METEHRRIAWLLVLVSALSAPASARQGRLIGKVVGPDGHPIPGVTVTTTAVEIAGFRPVATTDDKGLFVVDFPRVNVVYLYQLEKTGYVTLRVEQKWSVEGTERHEFKMVPAPVTSSAAPPASTSSKAIAAFNEGVLAVKARDQAKATSRFQEALSYDPQLRQAWAALSEIHLDQKRYKEAADAADKAVALGAREESVLRTRWEAYRNLGDKDKAAQAQQDLEKSGRLSEEAKRVHNEGVALSKAGDHAGAFGKFKEAVGMSPDFQPALLGLATSALEIGNPAEAAAAAETVLKADPRNEQALRIRYNAALKVGDTAVAVESLEGLAAVDPALARDSLFKLATAAYDSDDAVNARKRFGKVLELDPDHARAHYYLGLILMREGAKAEAQSHLERFLALAPADRDAGTARDALKYMKEH
jgi:Tfp pilus assembly protein PilF